MIHVEQHGQVVAIRMSRSVFGRPFWWTTAYWVDGLLIDTGPRFAARALLNALQNLHVDQVVLTHSHEDQIGGLPAILRQYPKVTVYASPSTLPFCTIRGASPCLCIDGLSGESRSLALQASRWIRWTI